MKERLFRSGFINISALSVILGLAAGSLVFAGSAEKDEYDVFDGTGKSGKTVNVIEWENNLEIHVYPKGSLAGLGLKIDEPSKGKKVMVIAYRFDNAPKVTQIRRAILSIPLRDGFKVYKDPSADDYDKVIISNNTLSDNVVAFKTDPPPTQLYPDGHPSLAEPKRTVANDKKVEKKTEEPAEEKPHSRFIQNADDDDGSTGAFKF